MIRRVVRARNPKELLENYPIEGRPLDWFFRIKEISNNAWLVEGCDLWGRKVSRSGGDPDQLLEACVLDAKAIAAKIK